MDTKLDIADQFAKAICQGHWSNIGVYEIYGLAYELVEQRHEQRLSRAVSLVRRLQERGYVIGVLDVMVWPIDRQNYISLYLDMLEGRKSGHKNKFDVCDIKDKHGNPTRTPDLVEPDELSRYQRY